MGRKVRFDVDYFPHTCLHKMTMFIIEQKYGNDGYAFWFKLLESLGSAQGHYIDFNKQQNIQFIAAKTHIPEDTCIVILNELATLEAIDADLWIHRIIWSQNFVDNLAEVYKNRRYPPPPKPCVVKTNGNVSITQCHNNKQKSTDNFTNIEEDKVGYGFENSNFTNINKDKVVYSFEKNSGEKGVFLGEKKGEKNGDINTDNFTNIEEDKVGYGKITGSIVKKFDNLNVDNFPETDNFTNIEEDKVGYGFKNSNFTNITYKEEKRREKKRKEKNISQKEIDKEKVGTKNGKCEYASLVLLTVSEFENLKNQFGEDLARQKINDLSLYKQSKGVKYKSDYATILNWNRMETKRQQNTVYNKKANSGTDDVRLNKLDEINKKLS